MRWLHDFITEVACYLKLYITQVGVKGEAEEF